MTSLELRNLHRGEIVHRAYHPAGSGCASWRVADVTVTGSMRDSSKPATRVRLASERPGGGAPVLHSDDEPYLLAVFHLEDSCPYGIRRAS